ncbi:hypothetical protein D3C71_1842480 [compost metagenome]
MPRRLALARRSDSGSVPCLPWPTPPKPAISAISTAAMPTMAGGILSPIRKMAAYSAQNRPVDRRRGCVLSVKVIRAVIASTKPASQ